VARLPDIGPSKTNHSLVSLSCMFRPKPSRRRPSRPALARKIQLEKLETRQLLAADSLGVTPLDTGEFLLGTVSVTPVFFESNGQIDPQTQNWSAAEIDSVLAKITEGVNWWSDMLDTLGTVHTLDFVIDDSFALEPFETGYEPIDRSSTTFNSYVGEFVTAQGFGDANSIEEAVREFNHAQRLRHQTDWAFTLFVVDSSEDGDGLFASGGQFAGAFAYAGGLFMVVPSTRPTSTFTHEMGHIFWARDEYPGGGSWTDRRGYYDTQNLNAKDDNPTPGFVQEISIMRGGVPLTQAFERHVSPASTLASVGWQDSDGDGVFDLADVPLDLDGIGYFDAETSTYHFSGTAAAVPLFNRNSSGPQSDITLNRVSRLQYSLDGGTWINLAQPNSQHAEFELSFPVESAFSSIRMRAIDDSTGITSEIITGSDTLPAISSASVAGVAFLDENTDGNRDQTEQTLAGTTVVVRQADGEALFGDELLATSFPEGELPNTNHVTLTADGLVSEPKVGSFALTGGGAQVFHSFDMQRERWINAWSSRVVLNASFDQAVGQVSVDVLGIGSSSYARLEAYDATGELIARSTSGALAERESAILRVEDAQGRIASVRAFGHADTSVSIQGLRFGFEPNLVTDASGALKIQNLPEGEYLVDLIPELVTHDFVQSPMAIQVAAGTSGLLVAAAQRVDSPRYNQVLQGDVSGDGSVSSQDALVIINDIARFGSRTLQHSETQGFKVDVSNDGVVSALDALLVINLLGRSDGESEYLVQPDQNNENISPQNPEMLNSAGDVVDNARSVELSADTTDQIQTGRFAAPNPAEKVSKLADFPGQNSNNMTNPRNLDPKNAGDLDQRFDEIQARISEPFENSLV
jgi:Dockerin type I domain